MFLLFLLAAAPPATPPTPPTVPDGFVARPAFILPNGDRLDAGTAFFAEIGDRRVLLTAHHLFGPAGGFPSALTPEQLPTAIKEVQLAEAWSGGRMAPVGAPVTLPGAHPLGKDAAGDVAMMFLRAGLASANTVPSAGRPLAATNAKVGQTVWVAAPVIDGPEATARLHEAKVVQVDAGWLIFDYKEPGLNLVATSGAPVLDKDGAIVGINLGGGKDQGHLYGSAAPIDAIRPLLTRALTP
jgi:hypothetical protein